MTVARTNYLARTTSFKDYLNEEYDADFDEQQFLKDCAYYFEQMKGTKMLMLHGTDAPVIAGKRNAFVPRGKPRDSSARLHDEANDFFEVKFRKPFRDGLFVTGKQRMAGAFGRNTAIIIPIGKFEWLMSPDIIDMTGLYDRFAGKDNPEDDERLAAEDKVINALKTARWNHNKDLPKCLAGMEETMLWCPKGFYTFTKLNLPKVVLE